MVAVSVVAFAGKYSASAFAGVVVVEGKVVPAAASVVAAALAVAAAGMQKVAAEVELVEQVLQLSSSFSISCV